VRRFFTMSQLKSGLVLQLYPARWFSLWREPAKERFIVLKPSLAGTAHTVSVLSLCVKMTASAPIWPCAVVQHAC
jgi:hypothetical protein